MLKGEVPVRQEEERGEYSPAGTKQSQTQARRLRQERLQTTRGTGTRRRIDERRAARRSGAKDKDPLSRLGAKDHAGTRQSKAHKESSKREWI